MNYFPQNHVPFETPQGFGLRQSMAIHLVLEQRRGSWRSRPGLRWQAQRDTAFRTCIDQSNLAGGSKAPSRQTLPAQSKTVRDQFRRYCQIACLASAALLLVSNAALGDDAGFGPPISVPHDLPQSVLQPKPRNWIDQTPAEAQTKSAGCLECHKGIDEHTMHTSPNVVLGCTDCHGGNPTPGLTQRKSHFMPRNPIFWETCAK